MTEPVPEPLPRSAPDGPPVLRVRDLAAWFDTPRGVARAVQRVSLEVWPKQVLGVVGESGSGKTQTFLSALALSPGYPGVVAGEAWVDGVNLLEGLHEAVVLRRAADGEVTGADVRERWIRVHRQRARKVLGVAVGVLAQDPKRSLVPYWTVGRHLHEVLRREHQAAEAKRRGVAMLAQLGFDEPERYLGAFPAQLSGGEAQRVMLALTVALRPRVLIADEPTTALDALNQERVLAELEALRQREQISLVLVSHDIGLVAARSRDVVVVYGGHVVERAPARALLAPDDASAHPYTRELQESHRRRSLGILADQPGESGPSVRDRHGCPYAGRCALRPTLPPAVQARCTAEVPPFTTVSPHREVACWGAMA